MATDIGFSGDGGIFLEVGADIDGAMKGLDTVDKKITGVGKNAEKLSQTKIDLKPTGRRELDDAARGAETLGKNLDGAGKKAKDVTINPALGKGIGDATRSSTDLGKALGGAKEQAEQLGGVDMTPSTRAMQGLAGAARDLVPALSAAAAGGAILTKGWNRLTAIDTAQAKLRGLGHDVQSIETIMESANQAVTGTAFGLADATTVAANLVAQNIEPGQELARVLTNVADASAIAGISLTEMGSIYNKIAAGDSVMAEELNQLGDRGLPILNMLAEELGVSAGAVRDLASEGQIGFAEFDAAIQRTLGGSAQAMGSSLIGTLDNVGAAAGRLGAALLQPGMAPVQSGANALIGTMNGLTGSVNGLIGAWNDLPEPVKTTVTALAGGVVATKALNSEMAQAAMGGLKSFTAGIAGSDSAVGTWVKNMGTAYKDASAHQRGLAADATAAAMAVGNGWDFADRQTAAFGHTVVGTMQGSAAAVKNGVGGIVNALGGPLALGLAGATWAIGEMLAEAQKLKRIEELSAQAAKASSQMWEDLAGHAASGDVAASLDTVESSLSSFLDAQQEMADMEGGGFFGWLGSEIKGAGRELNIFTDKSWQDARDEFQKTWDTKDDAEAFMKVLEDAGINAEAFQRDLARAVTGSRDSFDSAIERLQALGPETSGVQNIMNDHRRAFEEAAAGAELAGEKSILVSEGFGILSDEAADADDKVNALTSTLRAMAGYNMTQSEAMTDFRKTVNGIIEDVEQADWESGLGEKLFNDDNSLNKAYDNAIAMEEELLAIQDSYNALVMAGGDVVENYENGVIPALESMAKKYDLPIEKMHELAEGINLNPDTVETVMMLSAVEAMEGLRQFYGMVEEGQIKAGEPIQVTVENVDEAKKNFEDLGLQWETITGKTFTFSADTAGIMADIEQIVHASSQINTEQGITFTSNSEEVANLMDELDLKVTSIGDGEFKIESNTAGEIQSMFELGLLVEDPKTGEVSIDSNLLEVLTLAYELDARDGKVTQEFHEVVQREKRITYWESQGYSKAEAAKVQGPFPTNQYGGLAGFTTGGKLPMTGPGTERTDGILGVGSDGVPTAWVDKGEFVTNRASTVKYENLLWAINNDDGLGVIAAALAGLPGYAAGGQVDGAAQSTGVASTMTAGVQVGADTGGAMGALQALAAQAQALAEPTTIPVQADTSLASGELDSLETSTRDMEPVQVPMDANVEPVHESLEELAETDPVALELDTTVIDEGIESAKRNIDELTTVTATPSVGLDAEPLKRETSVATSTLDDLGAQSPVAEADLDHSSLDAGTASSMEQLHMVGGAKATSVSDVDNTSALANIQSVITALNQMPVERTIKVVAHGSTPALAAGGTVPGLATGGTIAGTSLPTTGPGTAQVDGFLGIDGQGMPLVRVDAGEYVTNRDSSQKYRTELELINKGLFPKLDNLDQLAKGARKAPGLATGGVVSPDQLLAFAGGKTVNGHTAPGSLEGSPYIWGGGLFSNWGDCSGAMSGLAALAIGMNPSGRKFATMSQGDWLLSHGFSPGLGPADTSFNLGWFNGGPWGGHTSGSIGGTNVEMGGGRGNGQIGGGAASPSNAQYTDHAHIALGELVAIDRYERIADIMQKRVPAGTGGYSATGGHGVSHGGGKGVTLHDQGGWLMPGTYAYNGLDTPEPVLKPEHWALVEQLIRLFPEHSGAILQAGKDIDKAAGTFQAVMRELANPESDTTVIARAVAEGLGETLSLTGANGLSSDLGGLIDAENTLNEARMAQAERAQAVADAELAILEARAALHDLENEDLSDEEEKRAEKITDAEKKVREARAGKDGKVDAEKVADAEKKLARVRKDAGKDAEEAEKKRAESITKATDDIKSAEQALADARHEQMQGLDMTVHSVLPQLSGSLTGAQAAVQGLSTAIGPQLASMGGAGAAAAGALSTASGALGGLAAAAGPAGMSVAAAIAAIQAALKVLEVIGEVAGRIGDAHAGHLRGQATGLDLFSDSMSRLGDVLDTVTKLTDAQIDATQREVNARKDVQDAQEAYTQAQRTARDEQGQNSRAVQQAEWDLAMARWQATQVAGAGEVDLAAVREKGIFEVLTYATAADRTAIQSAQDVAMNEARLAAAQARMEQAAFENALQVATANNELERAQITAAFEMDRLTNASIQLANAQALASGEIAGATGLERYLEGAAMVREGEANIAAGGSTRLQAWLNPGRWFQGDTWTGRNMEAEGRGQIAEGQAMMQAYAAEAERELLALPKEVQAEARKAMEKIVGKSGGSFENVVAGLADIIGGNSGAASTSLSEARTREALAELNAIIAESKHRMDAAELVTSREDARIDREEKRREIEWAQSDLTTQLDTWEQRDYLAELVELTERQLAEHEQENQQIGDLGSTLDEVNGALNKESSVMMSIGGSGWGNAPVGGAATPGGFGGLSDGDLSLWSSTRLEDGWINREIERIMVPAMESVGDAIATGGLPTGLPETVVNGIYNALGAEQAAAAGLSRNSQSNSTAELAAILSKFMDARGDTTNISSQFTGAVTVQSGRADKLASDLEKALARG